MVASEAYLVNRIVDQVHLGIEDQVDMFGTKDVALAQGRSLIVAMGSDQMRQSIDVFWRFRIFEQRSHGAWDGYAISGVKVADRALRHDLESAMYERPCVDWRSRCYEMERSKYIKCSESCVREFD